METLWQDVRFAARSLARTPGFTLTALLTLALGIGLNTAAFTVYDGIALRPLAVRNPREIVRVVAPADRTVGDLFAYPTYDLVRRSARAFMLVVATSLPQTLAARVSGQELLVSGRFVSDNYFAGLGVQAERGRLFGGGAEDQAAVVVSDAFWRARLAGAPNAVGTTLLLRGIALTIVGITPPEFAGTGSPPAIPDLWIPAAAQRSVLPGVDWVHDPAQRPWQILARLSPHRTIADARAELSVLARAAASVDSAATTLSAKPATLFQTDSGEFETFGQAISVLMIAVMVILFIGAGNLIGLVTARNSARERELAIRAALGASRARIARLLTVESLLLGIAGGALGLVIADWLCGALRAWIVATLADVSGGLASVFLDFSPDWRIVAFAAAAALLVGLTVGMWPAVRAARRDLHDSLKQGTTNSERRGRGRHLLLAAQLGVSLVLLSAAGVLLSGASRSTRVDPGFDAKHLLLLDINPASLAATPRARIDLLRRVVDGLRALPEVQAVAWTDRAPFAGHQLRTYGTPSTRVTFSIKSVSSEYFDALNVGLVSGRGFTPEEVAAGRPVMIVSASVAGRYWPTEDPVGRTVADKPWLAGPDSQPYTIIGVARDVRATFLSRVDEALYYPQPLGPTVEFLIRTREAPASLVHALLATLAGIDPLLPSQAALVPLENGPMRIQRLMTSAPAALVAGLALLGLILAAVGLYGVVAQSVNRRTREIGVRIALGAAGRDVIGMVAARNLSPLLWGSGLGLAGAVGVSSLFAALVTMPDAPDFTYGRGAFDPLIFAMVFLVLGLVVLVASIVPARRALRVDPVVALRTE